MVDGALVLVDRPLKGPLAANQIRGLPKAPESRPKADPSFINKVDRPDARPEPKSSTRCSTCSRAPRR